MRAVFLGGLFGIGGLGALLWAACAVGCTPDTLPGLPVDLDRQCTPMAGCQGGLLCVRVFREEHVTDGGVAPAMNYTCHPACADDSACPDGYRCYQAQLDGMPKVCVRGDVIDKSDGG